MNKTSPVEMRKYLELVDAFKQAGIGFIPIPILNTDDKGELLADMSRRLSVIGEVIMKKRRCQSDPNLPGH
jgi:hypothetical protein